MRMRLMLAPTSLLALALACSGAPGDLPEPDEAPSAADVSTATEAGASTLALATANDEPAGLDKGRGRGDARARRERRRHRPRPRPPEPPPGASCEAAGQVFPDGAAVPSGDSCNTCGCNDGDVICTLALCEPVACAAFIEEPDGVCSRFPLDPCISQDPDCTQAAPSEP